MKTRILSILSGLFFLFDITGQSQNDSIHHLPLFTVKENRNNRYACGLNAEQIDSLQLRIGGCTSIGEVLTNSTSTYLKTMGPGSLSSFTMRGGSVYQTAILWNGIDIRAPGAGMIDITLIPASVFESVEILHGGASALYGSGVIGGSLILKNDAEFKSKLEVASGISFASFSGNNEQLSIKWSGEKYYTSTAIFRQFSLNNFKYNYGKETRYNYHALQDQKGFMQNVQIRAGKNAIGGYSLWLQQSEREIAPSMTSSDNGSARNDASIRFLPTLKLVYGKSTVQVKAGWLHDYLKYTEKPGDSIILINSTIINNTISTETEYNRVMLNGFSIGSGVNVQVISVNINTNGGLNKQLQSAGFLDFRKEWRSGQVATFCMRHQLVEGYHAVVSPSIGLEVNVLKKLHLRSNISKNFRVPTMNDRFWQPGGNQNLKPEISQNAELGLDYKFILQDSGNVGVHVTAYVSDIKDWIAWVPGANLWTVQNIQHVLNRGMECSADFNTRIGPMKFKLTGSYTYVRSTYQKELFEGDLSLGKQLIYVPTHRFAGQLMFTYKRFILLYQHGYTGRTYVSRDNADFLPVYDVSNISLSCSLPDLRRVSFNLKFEVMNAWNRDYQVVQYFPMPGRWVRGGVVVKWRGDRQKTPVFSNY